MYAIPSVGRAVETARQEPRVTSAESAQVILSGPESAITESRTAVRQGTSVPLTLSAGSVEGRGVTVHQVRLGSKVQEVRVSRAAGVQVGDHNRQLNHYRFKLERPRMSLDNLLEGHPARLRSFERLVANPHSWMANYAFRRHLSAGPAQPGSRVLFAGASRAPTVRISARVDEFGATVVENSRGVQAADHSTQRNDFNYKLAGRELSLEKILHDRPDLARSLAMTVRHPGNPAVQRSFTHQISNAYTNGSAPSLRILSQDWRSSGLSVEQSAGVQLGADNIRKDSISVDIHRLALTGWDSAEQIAAKLDEPTVPLPSINSPHAVPSPAEPSVTHQAPDISWSAPLRRISPDPRDLGPSISPF
jgi:RIP homotypic interaction motif